MNNIKSAVNEWCTWASLVKYEDIPQEAFCHAQWAICNWSALLIQAQDNPLVSQLQRQMRQHPSLQAYCINGEMADPAWCAWVHAAAVHVEDYDDTHYATIIHPTAPILSAIMAMADARDVDNKDVQCAFILAVDFALRLGLAVYPSHYDRGFHITATIGVLAGAIGIALLDTCDQHDLQEILAIASCHSAGTKGAFGSMCKAYQVGKAAHDAVLAYESFAMGMSSGHSQIGDSLGFTHLYADHCDPSYLNRALGEHYYICDNAIKPYACGVVAHAAINAACLIHEDAVQISDIQLIRLYVHPRVEELTGNQYPTTSLQAKFSVYHACAAAILTGHAGARAFSQEMLEHDAVDYCRRRMELIVNEHCPLDAAELEVKLCNGETRHYRVEHAVSSIENPMNDDLLNKKWSDLLSGAPIDVWQLRTLCKTSSASVLMQHFGGFNKSKTEMQIG